MDIFSYISLDEEFRSKIPEDMEEESAAINTSYLYHTGIPSSTESQYSTALHEEPFRRARKRSFDDSKMFLDDQLAASTSNFIFKPRNKATHSKQAGGVSKKTIQTRIESLQERATQPSEYLTRISEEETKHPKRRKEDQVEGDRYVHSIMQAEMETASAIFGDAQSTGETRLSIYSCEDETNPTCSRWSDCNLSSHCSTSYDSSLAMCMELDSDSPTCFLEDEPLRGQIYMPD